MPIDYYNLGLGPIDETQLPPFQTAAFERSLRDLSDDFVRKHALEVVEQGYTVVPESIGDDAIEECSASFYAWKERNRHRFPPEFFRHAGRMQRIGDIQATLPVFRRLFTTNRCLSVLDRLFQREAALYTSLFFEVGSSQGLHRDIPYFWTRPANSYFGVWVALEATDAANGPLVVVPGSHRLPLLDRDAFAAEFYADPGTIDPSDQRLWDRYQNAVNEAWQREGMQPREIHANRGDTVIWHPLLSHGGARILDPERTRLSFVFHTTPYNVPVFHMDVFFNSARPVPQAAFWDYDRIDERWIRQTPHLNVAHVADFDYASSV